MKRASVRDLKIEVAEKLLPRVVARLNVTSASAGSGDGDEPQLGVALGIVPSREPDQDKLAVRIQDARIAANPTLFGRLVKDLDRVSKGDFEIRYIGDVARCSSSGTLVPPWYRCRARPLLNGCSIGHFDVTAGSIGGFFERDGHGNKIFVLSNNHVLAKVNRGHPNDAILQPGPADGGLLRTARIGLLSEFVPLLPAPKSNVVDAAVCELDYALQYSPDLDGTGNWVEGISDEPLDLDDEVVKAGRSTGVTSGVVSAIEIDDLWVNYDQQRLRFDGQVELEGDGLQPFAMSGDSGALVVDSKRKARALVFAVSITGARQGIGLTFANPILQIRQAFGLVMPRQGHPQARLK